MPPKVFVTGGTGFVGGSVLHALATTHPEYDITALLRHVPVGFSSSYPDVKIVKGNYDSADIISANAAAADIVVHSGDSDNETALNAIIAGLLRPRSRPGYLLHLSGTGIVADFAEEEFLGRLSPKIWSDVSSLDDIRRLPPDALHRNTETILHDTVREHGDRINVAIMCPPDIYGRGKGPGKQHSVFVDIYVQEIRKLQQGSRRAFYYGEGANTRSWVHIDDLMQLYLRVVEAAAAADGRPGECFNNNGYFFASTQEHAQIDVARVVGRVLHDQGVADGSEPLAIGLEQIDAMAKLPGFPQLGRYLFAGNSRTIPERAQTLFGYKGNQQGLLESLEADVLEFLERTK